MLSFFPTIVALVGLTSALPGPILPRQSAASTGSGTYDITPHSSYSSSIGVLGCKINYNRVAFWPMLPDCDNMCVKLTYKGKSTTVLHIDHSGGAYDISYDAWSRLYCDVPGTAQTCLGGKVSMQYEWVDMSQCSDIFNGTSGKLPISSPSGMSALSDCVAKKDSWTAQNYELYNIANSVCTLGVDEKCTNDWAAGQNQATCPSGAAKGQTPLTSAPVWNINYPNAALPPTSLALQ